METFDNEIMGNLLASSLETSSVDDSGWHDYGSGPGSIDGKYVQWLTISSLEGSVTEDVKRIRECSMVPSNIPIYGYIYDCKSGKLIEVPGATAAGKTS